jgi:AraC-like DNA-binding protein
MTPHTLSRRLKEASQSFRLLKQELRRDAAIEYLEHTSLPLDRIAERLGFSEPSTFHRAFKEWTGVTPGAYRAS